MEDDLVAAIAAGVKGALQWTNIQEFLLSNTVWITIENKETIGLVENNVDIINHVHISEPYLKPIIERAEHELLKKILMHSGYDGYVSLEMARTENNEEAKAAIRHMKLFGD